MKPILILVAAMGLAACITDPTPGYNPYCVHAGDTTGLGPLLTPDSTVVACIFTLEPFDKCYQGTVKRFTRTDCVEGTKWKG